MADELAKALAAERVASQKFFEEKFRVLHRRNIIFYVIVTAIVAAGILG